MAKRRAKAAGKGVAQKTAGARRDAHQSRQASAATAASSRRRRDREKLARRRAREARNALTNVDGFRVAPERARPSYVPVYQAFIDCIDEGKPATLVNVAKKLRRTRQALHQLLRRHPDLAAYIDRQIRRRNAHRFGLVMHRAYNLAEQGSLGHMEFVAKVEGGHYTRLPAPGLEPGDDGPPGIVPHQVIFNCLVPRPDYPALPPAAPVPAVAIDAPVIEVR